jgi:uncharacterized protein YjbJ (UPF0337 family)
MGAFEQLKGKSKEVVGELTGNDALEQEGKAQADKGVEETKANAAQAEAKAHEAAAEVADQRQKLAES